jgi:hypothetical protein
MSLTPLAAVAQLAAYMKQTIPDADPAATLYLSISSGMVRDYLQQEITAHPDDVVLLDPIGSSLFLPELPVTAVTLVETFDQDTQAWSTADPKTYTVSRRIGKIAPRPFTGVRWPSDPESWRVTYSHGLAVVPDGLLGVVLGVAARAYASEPGIDMERIGGYQVKYSVGGGFNDLEQKTLNRYVVARIA